MTGTVPRSMSSGKVPAVRSQSKTSRTVSARLLKWSLARSVKLGIFSRRVFLKEMLKTQSRKSTIDSKQRLLIAPDSAEGKQMALNASRRSRSLTDLHEDSDGEQSSEEESVF